MGRVALVLLWSLTAAVAGGEMCHYWAEGMELPAGAFQCPEPGKQDRVGAAFCCGTCRAPYCCTSAEARLEQIQCLGGDQLLVSSVPPATHHRPFSFYIAVGLTAATLLSIVAYFIYIKIYLPLRTRARARHQISQLDMPPSRVSFQDPSPNFTYGLGSRLRGPNQPHLYHAFTAPRLVANPPPPPSRADVPAQSSQVGSGQPGDNAARSSPAAALLDTAASGGIPEPEE